MDLNGAVLVGGRFSKTIDFGAGLESDTNPGDNGFVAKYGPGGVFIWRSVLDGAGALALRSLAFGADGAVVFAGGLTSSLKDDAGQERLRRQARRARQERLFAGLWRWRRANGRRRRRRRWVDLRRGGVFWDNRFRPRRADERGRGGRVRGQARFEGKSADLGALRGGAGDERATSLAFDPVGDLVVVGEMGPSGATLDFGSGPVVATSPRDGFVASRTPSFGVIYAKLLPKFFPEDVAVDALGNAVLVGTAKDATDLGGGPLVSFPLEDIVVLKLDAKGNHVHSAMYGSGASDRGSSVALGKFGEIFATGFIGASMNFTGGGAKLEVGAGDDIFLSKFAP